MDWKDALAALNPDNLALAPQDATDSAVTKSTEVLADKSDINSAKKPARLLTIFYEKKGRAGKPATIIAGFDPEDDAEALEVATTLKKRLGCGGSARGGEILLQGDRRHQLTTLLTPLGYKIKNPT